MADVSPVLERKFCSKIKQICSGMIARIMIMIMIMWSVDEDRVLLYCEILA